MRGTSLGRRANVFLVNTGVITERSSMNRLKVCTVVLCMSSAFGCASSPSVQSTADAGSDTTITSVAALEAQVEAKLPVVASQFSSTAPTSADPIYVILDKYLTDNPEFYGITLAVDPSRAPAGLAPYSYRTATGLAHKDLSKVAGYDFTNQDWYAKPKAAGAASWSAPYFDTGGGDINMVTYSLPVVSGGSFLGILTTDLGIDGRPAK